MDNPKKYNYKKLSHFSDMVNNMSNEPNKIIPYTDKQFEEDLKKWVAETEAIQHDKVNNFNNSYINYKVNNLIDSIKKL